jgi:formylglycine-generating enzyme required for sulfatase activity
MTTCRHSEPMPHGLQRLMRAALLLLLLWLATLLPAHAARLALVIGNKDYAVGPLKNPLNDAEAMAAALGGPGGLGFQVTLVRNLKRDDIGRTVEGFASRIRPGDDVVVFYAGHGLQVKGVNYLPAVDARINVESDVPLNSLNLNELLLRLDEAKAGVRLLLVDACRDNPYSRGFRSTARGLARVEGAPSGTLMHFATRPGGVADDGQGSNGVYTAELLKHLRTPNLPVESMLKRVASGVRQATGGSQQPWTEGALDGDFYFASAGSAATPTTVVATVVPEPVRPPAAQTQTPPQTQAVALQPAQAPCSLCPPMVVIAGGSFVMGSPAKEPGRDADEGPQRRVSVARFELGRTEVTQGQWRAVMGSNPSQFSSCGDDCPVERVSWDDAQAYIRKLNELSGRRYRLPSEAEWEYAARAGTTTPFSTGETISTAQANFQGNYTYNGSAKGVYREKTTMVCSFAANGFGLCDLHGNVWEWVEDVWHDSYQGAPTDGSARVMGGDQARRVVRGGSWNSSPQALRSADRFGELQGIRVNNNGFRIARTL